MKHLQSLAQKSVYWLKVISLGLILGVGIQFTQAWTNPISTPPGGNVSGPITTGVGSQTKAGGDISLGEGGNLYAGGVVAAPQLCIGGACRNTWPTSDNLGNHTATLDLNMNNHKITNVASPIGAADVATKGYVDGKLANYDNLPRGTVAGLCLTDSEGTFQSAIEPGQYIGYNGYGNQCVCRGGFSLITLSHARYSCIKN